MKKITKYRHHAISQEVCSYTNAYDSPSKFTLIIYKKHLLLLKSTHYVKNIEYIAYVFDKKATEKLRKIFQANTAKELFDGIINSFYEKGKEASFFQRFDDFCNMCHIESNFLTNIYYYTHKKQDFLSLVLLHFRKCYKHGYLSSGQVRPI